MADDTETTFAGWAVLELMGHRRLGGYVTEVELAVEVVWRRLEDDVHHVARLWSDDELEVAGAERRGGAAS